MREGGLFGRKRDAPIDLGSDGGYQSLEQIANWVRFADTKVTVLTAGLGVVLTMTMTNIGSVIRAVGAGQVQACVMGVLIAFTVSAFAYTLAWLTRALGPQSGIEYAELNRFAWPSLAGASVADLTEHVKLRQVSDDAWQQVIDLASVASRKFRACGRAVYGFAGFVACSVVLVATASVLGA